jgi:hypothetical protein
MKAYGEWRYRARFCLYQHEIEVSGQLHAAATLPPGKELPVHTGLKIGLVSEPVWKMWRNKTDFNFGASGCYCNNKL